MTDRKEQIKKKDHYSSEKVAKKILELINRDRKQDKNMHKEPFYFIKFTEREYNRITEMDMMKKLTKDPFDQRWKKFTIAEMQMYIDWVQNKQKWMKLMKTLKVMTRQKSQLEKFQAFLQDDNNKSNNHHNENLKLEVWDFVNHLNKKISLAKNPILVSYDQVLRMNKSDQDIMHKQF